MQHLGNPALSGHVVPGNYFFHTAKRGSVTTPRHASAYWVEAGNYSFSFVRVMMQGLYPLHRSSFCLVSLTLSLFALLWGKSHRQSLWPAR